MEIIKHKNYPNPLIWNANARTFTITHADMKIPVALVIKKGTILSPGGNILYKSGKVYEAVTAGTAIKMLKDHSFGIGDAYFAGATGRTISAIDTTSSDLYDTFTVDGVVTLLINEVVYSTASGAVASTGLAVIAEDVVYKKTSDTVSLAIADIAILDLAKMPNFWAAAIEASMIKAV